MTLKHILFLLLGLLTLQSCERIFDEEGDCHVSFRLHFRDDYNLLYADALRHDVSAITVCAYTGSRLLRTYTLNPQQLAAGNYTLDVSDLPTQTPIHFVAWANTLNNAFYTLTGTESGTERTLMTCALAPWPTGDRVIDTNVQQHGPLLYGRLDNIVYPDTFEATIDDTIPLMRDTKSVNILLQSVEGERLDSADFAIVLTSRNRLMDAENAPSEAVEYHPFGVRQGEAQVERNATREGLTPSALVAGLSTGRITRGDTLTITHRPTGRRILRIPLADYFLMARGFEHQTMPAREYLDRQSDYYLTLFLEEGNKWLATQVVINQWRVVLESADLH